MIEYNNDWPSLNVQLRLHEQLETIRQVEQKVAKLFADGLVPGFVHSSVGQEAVAVGVSASLGIQDTIASTHRGHGHALAKGLTPERFFLELLGREGGYCAGRGGSMHIADASVGMLGANGIVGAGLSIALGSALSHQVRHTRNIATVFFGDGALAEGLVHECFNLASLWKLPLLFVCENNGWAEFSPSPKLFVADLKALALAFAIPARAVDGNDVLAVAREARDLVHACRGGGPRLLECKTKRVRGHYEGDHQRYRKGVDTQDMVDDDPLLRSRAHLLEAGVPAQQLQDMQRNVELRLETAVAAALAAPEPSPTVAFGDVYAA